MKKIVFNIFIGVYLITTILITYVLLSYNKYNIAEFNNSYLFADKSNLMIVNKDDNIKNGDDIYYYGNNGKIKMGKVNSISDGVYTLDNEYALDKDSVLGNKNKAKSYAILGSIYSILTSKWGYLFIIIFPMLIAFVYEIYEIVKKIGKKTYIIGGIIVILLITFISYGRYIYNDIRDFYFSSKSFYFNSDKLTTNRAIYQVDNWSAVDPYTIVINMNSSKNNLVHANSDIDYNITYICSSNVKCSINKSVSTIYASSHSDSFTAVITPNDTFKDGDEAYMEIYANSVYPYKKKLSARFILRVGRIGLSYSIDDEVKRPYFNFNVTNTFDYYLVKQDFDKYKVDDRIDRNTYMELSDEDKKKCTSALISLSFDPRETILDMTSSAYLNAYNVSITKIDGYDYVNGISFKMDSESSETIKFYKADTDKDYSYPIVNDRSVIEFSYSQ